MPNAELIQVNYRGQPLSVSTKLQPGSDHLLLFLHGLGCAKESFDGAFTASGLSGFTICTIDFPGFGASSKPGQFSYTLEDHANVALLVVQKLAPAKVSIAAHSMGGAIGLLLAEKLPNLEYFINIEGNLVAEDCGMASRDLAGQSLDEFINHGSAQFLTGLKTSPRPDLQTWARWYQQASPQALHASTRSLVKWSDSGRLLAVFNSLKNKAYIHGDDNNQDPLLPRLEQAKIICISQAGHFMMLDNPNEFYSAIRSCCRKPD